MSTTNSEDAPDAQSSVGVTGSNGISDAALKVVTAEKESQENPAKKSKVDLQSLPTRQYLDQTVVPILLEGLAKLAKERPPDPINYLANYLMKNKGTYESSASSSPSAKRLKMSS